MLLHAAVFFGVLASVNTLCALAPRLISARSWVSIPFELALIGATSSVASVVSGDFGLDNRLALIAFTAVVLMRFFEARGELRQALSVVKKRGGEHERTIREFGLENGAIRVGEPLTSFRGVLTGVPVFEGPGESKSNAS